MSGPERNGILTHLWAGIVTIVVALVLQTIGAVHWAGEMGARMTAAERCIQRNERRLDSLHAGTRDPTAISRTP